MSLAPCPPASPRPLSPSYHYRMMDRMEGRMTDDGYRMPDQMMDGRRRQSSVSTSLASPGYSCALVTTYLEDIMKLETLKDWF
jgi:hypothetical protein